MLAVWDLYGHRCASLTCHNGKHLENLDDLLYEIMTCPMCVKAWEQILLSPDIRANILDTNSLGSD